MFITESDLLALFQEEDYIYIDNDDHLCQWLCFVLNETNPGKDYLSLLDLENLTLKDIQTFAIKSGECMGCQSDPKRGSNSFQP